MSSEEPPTPLTSIQDPEPLPEPPKLLCLKFKILITTAFQITLDILFILHELSSYYNYLAKPLNTFSTVLGTALSSLIPCTSFLRFFHILLQIIGVHYCLTNLKSGWRSAKVMCEFFTMLRFFLVIFALPTSVATGSLIRDNLAVVLFWLYFILNLSMLPYQSLLSDLLIGYKKAMNTHRQETDPLDDGIQLRRCFLLWIWFDEECID